MATEKRAEGFWWVRHRFNGEPCGWFVGQVLNGHMMSPGSQSALPLGEHDEGGPYGEDEWGPYLGKSPSWSTGSVRIPTSLKKTVTVPGADSPIADHYDAMRKLWESTAQPRYSITDEPVSAKLEDPELEASDFSEPMRRKLESGRAILAQSDMEATRMATLLTREAALAKLMEAGLITDGERAADILGMKQLGESDGPLPDPA